MGALGLAPPEGGPKTRDCPSIAAAQCRLFCTHEGEDMLKKLSQIQDLLSMQLTTSRGGIGSLSNKEWSEYLSRDREVAALLAALSPQSNTSRDRRVR